MPLGLKSVALVALIAYGVVVAHERYAAGGVQALKTMPVRRAS